MIIDTQDNSKGLVKRSNKNYVEIISTNEMLGDVIFGCEIEDIRTCSTLEEIAINPFHATVLFL